MRIEAQHNLCLVMVEERNLKGAEACLLGVYNMAPHLDYVRGMCALTALLNKEGNHYLGQFLRHAMHIRNRKCYFDL